MKIPDTNIIRCDKNVSDYCRGFYSSHKCGRPVFENGKCKIHCESTIKSKQEKSQAAYEDKRQKDRIQRANWMVQELDKYTIDFLTDMRDAINTELNKRNTGDI